MRNFLKSVFVLMFISSFFTSCNDNDDIPPSSESIQDFVWKGLNFYYLYQPQIANLNDAKNTNQNDLNNFLANFSSPENLFESLIYDRQNIDKYSVIFSDFNRLEGILSGTTKNNGAKIGFKLKTGSTTDIFGYVKYILPNSDASTKPIQRGTLFTGINGTPLTINNYVSLSSQDNYTLNLADYNAGNITPNGISVSLTKSIYSENPVFLKNTHTVGSRKMGYLVYNGFYGNYESELNDAFAYFETQNVTDLILDLRYNQGGSIATATRLGSMITGQFNGQVFSQQQWNPKLQSRLNPQSLLERFTNNLANGNIINNLNLSKVYILTSGSTASASELVINCLKPYITVVQIGTKTVGKNVGSITVYDSPTFRKQDLNPNHKYAMQPIVLKTLNKIGFGEYSLGITPDNATNILPENLGNLGVLGDANEPLLAKVLNVISLGGRIAQPTNFKVFDEIIDKSGKNLESEMYVN